MELSIIALVLIWVPCGFYAASCAASKDQGFLPWLIGGVLFGPIALIAAAGLGDRRARSYLRMIAQHQGIDTDAEMKAR